jgi:myo-inositol-1(or 4)-monophosphatase
MSRFLEICEKAVRASGALLIERLGRVRVREKGQADLVTEADFASQELVRRMILAAFPDHIVLGEEDVSTPGSAGADRARSPYRWIVDPLDGTTNYVHQVPHFSVSLALECEGNLLVGAVFDPSTNECFLAEAGQGAYLNGKRLKSSGVTSLSGALCGVGFPAVVAPDSADLRLFLTGLNCFQAFRRMGSASLNLCYVACGRFDAAWSFSTKAWDIAAGALLVQEAGGVVTSPDGSSLVVDRGHFMAAANPALHGEILALIDQMAS